MAATIGTPPASFAKRLIALIWWSAKVPPFPKLNFPVLSISVSSRTSSLHCLYKIFSGSNGSSASKCEKTINLSDYFIICMTMTGNPITAWNVKTRRWTLAWQCWVFFSFGVICHNLIAWIVCYGHVGILLEFFNLAHVTNLYIIFVQICISF